MAAFEVITEAHDSPLRCSVEVRLHVYILDLPRAFDIPRWRVFLLSPAAETTLSR